MDMKKLPARTLIPVNIVLFVAIIIAFIILAERHFKRFDLTANQSYTLSEGSRSLVSSLKDVLHIKVYMTTKLPQELNASAREVRDTLEEFRSIGGRMVSLSFIDPGNDEALKAELNQMGILELRATVRQKERQESRSIYFSAALLYRNRKELILNLSSEPSLELAVSRAIKKLTTDRIPKVAYITSNGTASLDERLSGLYKTLIESNNFARVDLEKGERIPADADIAFLAGPRVKLSTWAKFALDQYLMGGGRLVVFADQIRLNDKMDGIVANPTDLDQFLAHYGFKLNTDMVCDNLKMGHLVYNYGNQRVMDSCPAIVRIDKASFDDVNNTSAVTKGLQSVFMPWSSSMELDTDKLASHRIERLLVSSQESTVQQSNYNVDPSFLRNPIGEKRARLMGALVSGPFTSQFKGADAPTPPPTAEPPKPGDKAIERLDSTEKAHIAVVTSSYFAGNDAMSMMGGQYRVNMLFLQNLFDYLGMGDELIGIRMKGATMQAADEQVLNKSKTMLWLMNVLLMPLVVLLFGIVWKLFSYMKKRSYEQRMGR
jgi:gliding-associated putative ABC transporter substrate-binding component GldG